MVVVEMVTAFGRVAFIYGVFGGVLCDFGSGRGVFIVVLMVLLLPPTTTTATTIKSSFNTSFTTQQTLKYGTSVDGGGSGIGWVGMVMAVRVV